MENRLRDLTQWIMISIGISLLIDFGSNYSKHFDFFLRVVGLVLFIGGLDWRFCRARD